MDIQKGKRKMRKKKEIDIYHYMKGKAYLQQILYRPAISIESAVKAGRVEAYI